MAIKRQPSPHERINIGEEDEMIVEGYVSSLIRYIFFGILMLCSFGTLLLAIAWRPGLRIFLTHKRCSLSQAQKILLKDKYDEEYVESIIRPLFGANLPGDCIHFYHRKIKYVWREELNQFSKLKGLEAEKCGIFYSGTEGLSTTESILRAQLYGINSVFVEIKPIWKLIFEEITGPFYIYQMFIFTVWMVQFYYQFAMCVLLLSIISVSMHVWQTRKQAVALREKVHSESEVVLMRDGKQQEKVSTDLVPGDVLILPIHSEFIMECDAVLISGNCTVDESMLTGESIPISKVALSEDPNTFYSPIIHKKSTLFCGTQVMHVQLTDCTHVKAIVIRTGFSTKKGELVRSILFPRADNFKLKYDLIKCMGIFFSLGIPCMVYTAYCFMHYEAALYDIIIIVIDVATFLVPPLLPAVMTGINAHAQRRLKKEGLFCLNPNAINACGGLDLICFDKTGTLTEDSIDLSGVIPVENNSFEQAIRDVTQLPTSSLLLISMGTCHSLVLHNGRVKGENLDLKLFDAVKWEFKEDEFINDEIAFERYPDRVVGPINQENKKELNNSLIFGIIMQFPFESLLQRMVVIVKEAYKSEYLVIMKGAPEVVVTFCNGESVPHDFNEILESYTRDGLRVIASASKIINASLETCLKMSREKLETQLRFDGLIVFQNCLKKQTSCSLNMLKKANIRTVMVTGDNILTAISVARNCCMIEEQDSVIQVEAQLCEVNCDDSKLKVSYNYAKLPGFSEKLNMKQNGAMEEVMLSVIRQSGQYHLAMEGKTFDLIKNHDQELLDKVSHKGTIFARMLPQDKCNLVQVFQGQGHQVGMCGDGANDCGALRAANAGVSLSVAESSVASPFTYREKDISCMPMLVREGRATLAATFGAFKYQVCYCFLLLGAVLILFWDGSKPSDGAYVFIDIILNILPPMVFGTTKAYPHLVNKMPTRSILSFLPQFSMYSFILFQVGLYIVIRKIVITQAWYIPFQFDVTRTHMSQPSHLASAIFSVNMISYTISAIIFSPGPPFRRDIFSNKYYLAVVFLNFALVCCVVLFPPQFILYYLNFKDIPDHFKTTLFMISIANFIFSYIWEVIFLQGFVFNNIMPRIRAWRGPIHKHEMIEQELANNENWPPVVGNHFKGEQDDKDNNHGHGNRNRVRPSSKLWAMRSASNEDEYDGYTVPFDVVIDSELDIENEKRAATFVTFMDGTHKVNQTSSRDSTF